MHRYAPAMFAALLTIGSAASAQSYTDYHVYTPGDANIAGGSYGRVASATFTSAPIDPGSNYISHSLPDASRSAQAIATSAMLRDQSPTGTSSSSIFTPGFITLTGTQADTNVFSLTGAQFNVLMQLTFAGPGTGAVVNVGGTSLSSAAGIDFGALLARNVVFNFYEATSVSLAGMDFRGSILAPYANLSISGGSVDGTVESANFSSAGTTIGGIAYVGVPTSPAPEPASWAMMIAGFALVGAALRRRNAVPLPA